MISFDRVHATISNFNLLESLVGFKTLSKRYRLRSRSNTKVYPEFIGSRDVTQICWKFWDLTCNFGMAFKGIPGLFCSLRSKIVTDFIKSPTKIEFPWTLISYMQVFLKIVELRVTLKLGPGSMLIE